MRMAESPCLRARSSLARHQTALIQIAAEELLVEPQRINLITADTRLTPNEGYTAGSQSMQNSGTAILNAAAQVRVILVELAAARLNVPAGELIVQNGAVRAADGRALTYGELVTAQALHVSARPESVLRDAASHSIIGRPLARVDIPTKVCGEVIYVQDLRLPGMARAGAPPSYGARLRALDTSRVERTAGFLKVVRDGDFIAVIAEREYEALPPPASSPKRRAGMSRLSCPTRLRSIHVRTAVAGYGDFGAASAPDFGAGAIAANYFRPRPDARVDRSLVRGRFVAR